METFNFRCHLFSCFICFLEHLITGQAKTNFEDMTCELQAENVKLVHRESGVLNTR